MKTAVEHVCVIIRFFRFGVKLVTIRRGGGGSCGVIQEINMAQIVFSELIDLLIHPPPPQ